MSTPPLAASGMAPGPFAGPQAQQAAREVNTASLCRIGQETVQDIVYRTMEIFQLLRNMQVGRRAAAAPGRAWWTRDASATAKGAGLVVPWGPWVSTGLPWANLEDRVAPVYIQKCSPMMCPFPRVCGVKVMFSRPDVWERLNPYFVDSTWFSSY